MKKTPFQRAKEAQEKKKREEEAEAAKVYEDFVEAFGEGSDDKPAASTSAPSSSSGGIRTGGVRHVPSFLPPGMPGSGPGTAASNSRPGAPRRSLNESHSAQPPSRTSDRGKPRAIDRMMDIMKREQEIRDERQKARRERGTSYDIGGPSQYDDGLGSFDDGDPFTTNLYIGNLAIEVDEETLKREFLRFGDIASIKIMWPREVEKPKTRNCGFVAFMKRDDAQRAKDELNGVPLKGVDLKIGWGKAVVLPPIPVYSATGNSSTLNAMIAKAKAVAAQAAPPGQVPPPGWGTGKAPMQREADPHEGRGPEIVVKPPEDDRLRFIIDSVAIYVMVDGCAIEQALMTREAQNPEFMFLFDLSSPEHAYYRWRVYSLAQGDSLRSWRNEPFVMVEGGPRWVPPTMTQLSNGREQTAAQRGGEAKDKDRPLSDAQRDKFEDLLRALTMERSKICEAMVFTLDNAESASEIVEILTDSLTLIETPMTTKVARLMLVSDVLHNSSANIKNASRYRGLLESSLAEIFESLQETYKAQESRTKQEVLRRNVLRVLRIWRSWFIFSDDFINGLQATFLEEVSKDIVNPALQAEFEALDDDALATKCKRNGLTRTGDRAAQLHRLLSLHSYLSGDKQEEPPGTRSSMPFSQPILEIPKEGQSIFGSNEPPSEKAEIEVKAQEPPKEDPKPKPVEGPVSKWTLVDYDDETTPASPGPQEAVQDIFSDAGDSPQAKDSARVPDPFSSPEPAAPPSPPRVTDAAELLSSLKSDKSQKAADVAEESKRAQLRKIEVDIVMLREKLEDKGLSKTEIDKLVEAERAKLTADIDTNASAGAGLDRDSGAGIAVEKDTKKGQSDNKSRKSEAGHSKHASGKDKEKASKHSSSKDKDKDSRDRRKTSKKRSRSPSRSRRRSLSRSRSRSRDRKKTDKKSRQKTPEKDDRHKSSSRQKSKDVDVKDSKTEKHSRRSTKESDFWEEKSEKPSSKRQSKDSKSKRERSRSKSPRSSRHNRQRAN